MSDADFVWAEFLAVARALIATSQPTEAALRTAVSRAYYAAFGSTRSVLVEKHSYPSDYTRDDHTRVWERCEVLGTRTARDIATLGQSLKLYRWRADYRADQSCTAKHAELAVNTASRLISLLPIL